MMTFHLPADLEEEILSRVPTTSLMRWRSICRRWNTLFFEDQRFSEKHFRNAPKQPLVLMLTAHRLFFASVDLKFVPPSIEFSDALSLKHYNNSKVADIVKSYSLRWFVVMHHHGGWTRSLEPLFRGNKVDQTQRWSQVFPSKGYVYFRIRKQPILPLLQNFDVFGLVRYKRRVRPKFWYFLDVRLLFVVYTHICLWPTIIWN